MVVMISEKHKFSTDNRLPIFPAVVSTVHNTSLCLFNIETATEKHLAGTCDLAPGIPVTFHLGELDTRNTSILLQSTIA
jgi:hypothetical protein